MYLLTRLKTQQTHFMLCTINKSQLKFGGNSGEVRKSTVSLASTKPSQKDAILSNKSMYSPNS